MNTLDNFMNDLEEAKELKRLDICREYFRNINKDISVFTNLEYLDCSSNQITKISKAISKCERLTELNISGNKIRELPDSFSLCTNLIVLKCNNNIICNLDLNNLNNLCYLDCSKNKLNNCFIDKCNKLTFINLQYNLIQNIVLPNFENNNINMYFEYNILKNVPNIPNDVIHMSLSANSLTSSNLNKDLFEYNKCKILNLSQNKISDKEIFNYIPTWIHDLNLSTNRFYEDFILKNDFNDLKILNVSNNNIERFEIKLDNLIQLYVGNNQITYLNISECKNLNTLIANNNCLDENNIIFAENNNKLSKIDFSYNNFKKFPIHQSDAIEYINFEHNEIQKVPKNTIFKNLSYINLSLNKINKISKEFCMNHKKLKILNVSCNELINVPNELFNIETLEKVFAFNNNFINTQNMSNDTRFLYTK